MKGPLNWKTLPFETAVKSRGSGSSGLPQNEWLVRGRYPVIGQGSANIEGWTDREDLLVTSESGVVLYGGHTRRTKHVSQPFVPGPNVKILQPISAINSKFLYYFLTQLPIQSRGYADHFPLVRESDIPVPTFLEQERIVKLLDETDELRKLRTLADRRAADLIPALFHEMFGDPEVNQNNWPRVKVKDAVDLINGRAFKPTEWSKNGLPIIRIQNLKNATANFNLYDGSFDPKHRVKNGALLISWAGQLVSFGVHIWDGPEGVLNQHIFKVEPRMTFEMPFLKHALSYVVERAKSKFQGSEMKHLTRGTLDEAEILSPPLLLQKEFSQRVNEISELETAQAASRQRVEHLFQSMLHRAFNQEL